MAQIFLCLDFTRFYSQFRKFSPMIPGSMNLIFVIKFDGIYITVNILYACII